MAQSVIMPRQGQSVESCILTEILMKEGDAVKTGDILFTCETDKASFEVESEFEGVLLKWLAEEGDDVPCLDNVCVIGEAGEDISAFLGDEKAEPEAEKAEVTAESTPKPSETAQPVMTASAQDGSQKISPRARNLANKQGIDTSAATPTGPDGRVIERDIEQLIQQGAKVTTAAAGVYQGGAVGTGIGGAVTTADLANISKPSALSATPYDDVPLTNVRKVIAKAMHASLSEMAQLTLNASFDASEIMAFRAKVKKSGESSGLSGITINDMILFSVAKTLKLHKDLNAHFLGDKIRYFNQVNLGIAVDTERGLLVPTLFGADMMELTVLSASAKEVIGRAKTGSISPDDLIGGTFTVTNLGALGIESFTPVINPPQTAILGVCNIAEKVKTENGQITTYPSMGLSLTFDHRALDGAPAARFLKDLCEALESFSLLLIK